MRSTRQCWETDWLLLTLNGLLPGTFIADENTFRRIMLQVSDQVEALSYVAIRRKGGARGKGSSRRSTTGAWPS